MRDHAKDAARLREHEKRERCLADMARTVEGKLFHIKCANAFKARADRIESTNADLPDSDTLHKAGLVGRKK